MKPIPWGKEESDAHYCETFCNGYESHTGRCVGWALWGNSFPRHPERKFCLNFKTAWAICPKNKESLNYNSYFDTLRNS